MILDLSDDAVLHELWTVQRLAYAVEAEIIGFDGIPALHETLDELRASDETFLGSYDEEGLVGAVSYRLDGSTVDICRLVVHPRAHRRGIATRLLDALPDGPQVVSTGAKNEPALRLYRKRGFVETGTREVGPGVPLTDLARR
ncbi:Acetyltransferase (GNAT) domain-containing protein [Lentzea xinjiangensis]|uniref:Acetyltransferase (GNAT) domain-containing protein n=1 Tax=Lentzea xinjiangensis TaxID=402600 RepID=A0A1H9DXH7_9PSEU|nr:GNAT family N-acetyltransferase [Lentzea xinjiangensis]SEQ18210.1 Acetyltransferase (GNAT) domain-containing protein [Lentzea xinjiangensis]